MTQVTLLYFASLRDAAGMEQETVTTSATNLTALYAEISTRHGFTLPQSRLRVAMDDAFVRWDAPLRTGSRVAFIPPVSGG